MSTTRLLGSCLKALGRHKLRSVSMTIGSLIGVTALTLVLTIGTAAQAKILDTVRQLFGPSAIIVISGGGFFLGGPRGEAARLTLDDAEALAEALPEDIEIWDPMQVVPGSQVRRGDQSATVRLLGRVGAVGEGLGSRRVAGRVLRCRGRDRLRPRGPDR